MSLLPFRVETAQFILLLDLYRIHCREVQAVPVNRAATLKEVTIVRGVACAFELSRLQKVAVRSKNLYVLLRHLTNWGEEKLNEHVTRTKLHIASLPKKNVDNLSDWFYSAIVLPGIVREPTLLLATVTFLTGFHKNNLPPTSVVASLLRGRKWWLFASHGSKKASRSVKGPEVSHLELLLEDLINNRYPDILYCVQEPGERVCFPARTVHFVLSVTSSKNWNCLLSHNNKYNEAEAAETEGKSFSRCNDQRVRVVQRKRTTFSGVTNKSFTAGWRAKSQ